MHYVPSISNVRFRRVPPLALCGIMSCVNITKKIKKLAKSEVEALPEHTQRYYAVWRYQNKHKCSLCKAYEAVYKCSYDSARAASARMAATQEWKEIVDRMEEAASVDPDNLKTEIVASMLSIIRNPRGYPADKVKAAATLNSMFGLAEQKVTVSIDPVAKYAEQVLAAAEAQPLISADNDTDAIIDV